MLAWERASGIKQTTVTQLSLKVTLRASWVGWPVSCYEAVPGFQKFQPPKARTTVLCSSDSLDLGLPSSSTHANSSGLGWTVLHHKGPVVVCVPHPTEATLSYRPTRIQLVARPWWYIPLIPALRRWGQADLWEFEASLV